MEKQLVARWLSRSGKHFVELYYDQYGYSYKARGEGGYIGHRSEKQAVDLIEGRILRGDFQPDKNKNPLARAALAGTENGQREE